MTTPPPPPTIEDLQRHRPRLLGLAYRMLGELAPAEDVVQDAFLRWHQEGSRDIQSAEAWLVTVVSRLAIDRLRRAATERAAYDGPWLPEPVLTEVTTPEQAAERASDLSVALLVLLESLKPEERVAFLLREVFGEEYGTLARVLGRNEPAVRQLVHRARERVREGRPRFPSPPGMKEQLLQRFLSALGTGDQAALVSMLAPGVTFTSDGGGKAYAARKRIDGADRIIRMLLGLRQKLSGTMEHRIVSLNGQPAALTFRDGLLFHATMLDVDGEHIRAIYRVLNPDKLQRLERDAIHLA
ncbi:RNA polymerase sigma factor SigJ [Myxococcus faecalis]|uniref:RNA polymerase sigma factor SigJ n=1 Tax=Myxococcus faecalis TaxID=3115646 RepID=UPI003CE8FFAB